MICTATNDLGVQCAMPPHGVDRDHIAQGVAWRDEGATRRDRGHADALSHYVVEVVRLTIRQVAERRGEFTSEDVVAALPEPTRASLACYPNATGACFRAAAIAGEIMDTGRVVRATHPEARKRKIAVWSRGLFVVRT